MEDRFQSSTRAEFIVRAVLFVGALCLAGRTTWGSPYALGAAFDLAVIVLSGYLLKLGDDLVDEWRLIRLGGVLSCIAVLGLCVIVARRQELFWLVGGGSLGILAARKVDHFGAVVAYLGFWLVWVAAIFLLERRLRVDLFLLGAIGMTADQFLEIWANRQMVESHSATWSKRVLIWVAGNHCMVTVLSLGLAAFGYVEYESCALILGYELGYTLGEVKCWADRIVRQVAGLFQGE